MVSSVFEGGGAKGMVFVGALQGWKRGFKRAPDGHISRRSWRLSWRLVTIRRKWVP
jgi:hypothetical protein